jgi:hypothetical protein
VQTRQPAPPPASITWPPRFNKDFADAGAKLRILALEPIDPANRDAIRDPVLGLHAATANSVLKSMIAMHSTLSGADVDKICTRVD